MSISEARRYPDIINQHQSDHRLGSLFTHSPFPSPPTPTQSRHQAAPPVAQPPHPYPPSPESKPSANMQIPPRQAQAPSRDTFPFNSPPQPSVGAHAPPSPHRTHPHPHPLTRHESFSSHHPLSSSPTDSIRPRPPPLRTVQSAYTPRNGVRQPSPADEAEPGPSQVKEAGKRNSGDAGDMDELTTKGRKRKRLAKACSACHKNKRRCDGFAPCSNCEFSSRPCLYLNAMGETIPPPRTRDSIGQQGASGTSTPGAAGKGKGGSKPMSQTGSGQGSQGQGYASDSRMMGSEEGRGMLSEDGRYDAGQRGSGSRNIPIPVERRRTVSEVVEGDPVLSAELIDTFFRISAPFNAMFHPPTFHHRLYLSQTSPILLDAIYAFAARGSTSPALLACYPPDHPPWLRGEAFAERAHAAAERIVTAREADLESGINRKEGTWEEMEEIQAFTLLSIYFACLRQPTLAHFYLDLAITILKPTFSGSTRVGSQMSPVEFATLAESRIRTFWLIALHDLCAAANGRPRMLKDSELEGVPLPGTESLWVRYGGGLQLRNSDGWKRRDGLVQGTGNWAGEEGQVGELGHVLRILSIFSNIMAVANSTDAGPDMRSAPLNQHQEALKSWAQNLPPHLRFDEHNLSTSITRLNSPVPHIAFAGWAFGYMHAIAECGMFYLQAAVAQQPGANWTYQRQTQAVDNIAVVLDAMGERGREGPLMVFPIAVVSNWQDHVCSLNPAPTPPQLQLDDRLVVWWAEAKHQWGAERAQVLNRGYQPEGRTSLMPIYAEEQGRRQPTPRVLEGDITASPWSATTANGRFPDPHSGRRSFNDHGVDPRERRYPEEDEYHRRQSLASGSRRLNHLLDAAPIPIGVNSKPSASGQALGLYSFDATSPRDIMANTAMRNGHSYGSSDTYPYSRSESHPGLYIQQSQANHRHSPPDLAHSVSTSASNLLPTPFSTRPSLPPLPPHPRPRAISSVIPYSVTREPSPVSAPSSAFSMGNGQRHPSSLSFSAIDGEQSRQEGASPAGSKGFYLPPSAELRQLRQLDDLPRSGSGLGLGLGKGWRPDPFSPSFSENGTTDKKWTWMKEEIGEKGDATTSKAASATDEPLGIAALISAAESEREKEEKRRESEGSATSREERAVGEDVEMKDDTGGVVQAVQA